MTSPTLTVTTLPAPTAARPSAPDAPGSPVRQAAAVLAQAFTPDPVMAGFVRERAGTDRTARLADFFEATLRSGSLPHGAVDVARDAAGTVLGVAAWEAPSTGRGHFADQVRELPRYLSALGVAGIVPALRAERTLQRHRPPHPHWYLLAIGVGEGARGLGVGRALLEHRLAELDRSGLPAYLEGSTARNQALYGRLGFVALGPVRGLASGAAPLAMWRPARTGA